MSLLEYSISRLLIEPSLVRAPDNRRMFLLRHGPNESPTFVDTCVKLFFETSWYITSLSGFPKCFYHATFPRR